MEDGLSLIAAVRAETSNTFSLTSQQFCTIGMAIIFPRLIPLGADQDYWQASLEIRHTVGPWLWASVLVHILGISFVKLSITFFMLRSSDRNYLRYLLYGLISMHCYRP